MSEDDSRNSDAQNRPDRNRVGCASSPNIAENVEVSPSGEPSFDDCYTTLLHNRTDDPGLTIGQRSRNRARDF
jgi:hypothetical protein